MFTLKMATDNAAFGDIVFEEGAEIARILREIANRVESDPNASRGSLIDYNGNKVGEFEWILEA